jgi:hypothetical protein
MANKIGVLESFQEESEAPQTFTKRRISNQLVEQGYARRVSRWLIKMTRVNFAHALNVLIHADSGELKAEGPPSCSLASYPVRDQTSSPKMLGARQNWAEFPC